MGGSPESQLRRAVYSQGALTSGPRFSSSLPAHHPAAPVCAVGGAPTKRPARRQGS